MRRFFSLVFASIGLLSTHATLRADAPILLGDPYETPWGKGWIKETGEGLGVGYAEPEDGHPEEDHVFPSDLPPIVHASLSFHKPVANPSDRPFEFDPQSGALILRLPTDPGERANAEGGSFAFAKQTAQSEHGVIVFPAQSATVRGETAKLESNGSNVRIGFWTDPKDEVVWSYDATRWGRYVVRLIYSTEAPDGAVAEIEIGGEKLEVELPSTGSWYRYRQISAGEIYLAEAGKKEVIVRAKTFSGVALMNLKAIVLEPTYESPERPKQAEDGSITLKASEALVNGVNLRYEPKPEKNTLGYWTKIDDQATWTFEIDRPGTFEVEVFQGCGTGQGGSTMSLLFSRGDATNLEFVVEETGHFQNFKPRIVGQVVAKKAGEASLVVKPAKIAKAAACDIRQIRLIPVAPAKP
jgi:hypothetical protein